MYDIVVQNGSIGQQTKERIFGEYRGTNSTEEMLVVIANARADAAGSKWREDVRSRKLCIAHGHGMVHGVTYNLEDYGL